MAAPLRSWFLKLLSILGLLILVSAIYPAIIAGWEDPLEFISWLLCGGIVVTMLIRTQKIESRTRTLDIFFMALFFFGLMGELLRPWFLAATQLQLGAGFRVGLVRALYSFRILSLLSLFTSTLYLCGWSFRRTSRVVPVLVILALSVAWILPISSEVRQWNGLYQLGVEDLFQSSLIFFVVLSVVARLGLTLYMPERGRWYVEVLLGIGAFCWIGLLYGNPLLFMPPLAVLFSLYLRLTGSFLHSGE